MTFASILRSEFLSRGGRQHPAERVFAAHLRSQQVRADYVLATLLLAQWGFAVFCAAVISPYVWEGAGQHPGVQVGSAVVIGGLLSSLPCLLVLVAPGERLTRMVLSAAQMLFSVLLIHLMAGRIESHFHVFGSLAILAFYKDRWVFVPAVLVVVLDHLIRGMIWPYSVYGLFTPSPLRVAEHTGWILFEVFFLVWGVNQNLTSLRKISELQSSLTSERDLLERRVELRTAEVERQQRFQETILQNIPAAVFWKDVSGAFRGCNESFCRFLGFESPAEVVGKTYRELLRFQKSLAESDSALLSCTLADLNGSTWSNHECLIDASGQPRHVIASLTTLQDEEGVVFGVLGTFHDITSLKRAESRATALAHVIRESPNEVFILDAESLKFVEANKGACENLGYNRREIQQMTPMDISPTLTVFALRERIAEVRRRAPEQLEFYSSHRRKDGSTYPVQISIHEAMLGDLPVFVAFASDLTQRRKLEQQLSQSQKLESIGQLAAGVAHEINTPMQCVSGNVEFLKAGYDRLFGMTNGLIQLAMDESLDPSIRRSEVAKLQDRYRYDVLEHQTPAAIGEAADAVQRVIDIVRAMKVMSHPGNRRRSDVDLRDLISQASIITRNRWKYAAELQIQFEEDFPCLHAFPAELTQVFMNLIVNAADAIAERYGESDRRGHILIKGSRRGEVVQIQVMDDGAGIAPDVKARIFDQFFTTKDVGKGTGLGLALTYDIVVRQHGGKLTVNSELGRGTEFLVTLPQVAPEPQIHKGHQDDLRKLGLWDSPALPPAISSL